MAVSTTATTTMTRDQLLTLGAQAAGLLNAGMSLTPEQISFGASMLWLGLQDLQTKGMIMRATDRYTLTLVAGQSYADMPADTVSIEKGITVKAADLVTDLPVILWARENYQGMTNKTTQGRPIYCYPEEITGGAWRLYFWPVPTVDFASASVPRAKMMRDITTGDLNIDLDPKWLRTVVHMIGRDFASHFGSPGKVSQMQSLFDQGLGQCLGDEVTRGDFTFTVGR